ncbi:MAG: 50S ribosome-binding GTPase, partial [Caulobacterales bacterium]|nr:50S ribosome-binding GTPase [Caulobacterales bacterium]
MSNLPNPKTMIEGAQSLEKSLGLLRFITCGSVDDGKSTLIGRLLYDAGQVYEDHLEALDEASKKFGTQGQNRDFALLVDGLAAEREQGITIDVAYRYFRTQKRAFIVADTPGHEQYTRNMATGASNAEVAIILIDARKGVLAQTRRHALIVSMLGVKNIALAINKMDLVNYDKAIYEKIIRDFHALSPMLKFEEVRSIPISAVNGENIAKAAIENMPWYKGPNLLDFLENVEPRQNRLTPFRFPVQWVNRPNLNFRGFSGYVSSGEAKVGQKIKVSSSGQIANILRIVTLDGDMDKVVAGQAPTIV